MWEQMSRQYMISSFTITKALHLLPCNHNDTIQHYLGPKIHPWSYVPQQVIGFGVLFTCIFILFFSKIGQYHHLCFHFWFTNSICDLNQQWVTQQWYQSTIKMMWTCKFLFQGKRAKGGKKRVIENGEKGYALKLIITNAPFKPQHIIKINKHEDRYNCSNICHVINT